MPLKFWLARIASRVVRAPSSRNFRAQRLFAEVPSVAVLKVFTHPACSDLFIPFEETIED